GAVVLPGASGLIGRALSAHLAARGWEVRALVRDPAGFGPPPAGLRVGRCDLPDTLDEALLAGADAVVHAAYATRETDRERARRVNEDGTRRLLEASRRARVPRFVFVSTVAAHPEAPNYYARSKHALEGLCDPGHDLVVRPGLVLAREGHGIFQMMRGAAGSGGARRASAAPLRERARHPGAPPGAGGRGSPPPRSLRALGGGEPGGRAVASAQKAGSGARPSSEPTGRPGGAEPLGPPADSARCRP